VKQLKESLTILGQIYSVLFHFPMAPLSADQGGQTPHTQETPLAIGTLDLLSRLYSFTRYCDDLGNVFGKSEVRASVAMIFKSPLVQGAAPSGLRGALNKAVFYSPSQVSPSPSPSLVDLERGSPPVRSSFSGHFTALAFAITQYSTSRTSALSEILSNIYYDALKLGMQNSTNSPDDRTDSNALMEEHICWVLEMTLQDLSHSPMVLFTAISSLYLYDLKNDCICALIAHFLTISSSIYATIFRSDLRVG
jgi:hypothetical protein